ncbi:MAG: domain containing protein [Cyanobacteria bacterium RYN_339]|nr:domain containing protein [Cyanobacteria bacterium RYN_339]
MAGAKVHSGAVPVVQDTLDGPVARFVGLHKDALGLKHLAEIDLAAVTRVIVVDTQSPARLGPVAAALERPDVEWVVYDHHPAMVGDLPPSPGRREVVGAATSLLVQELERRNVVVKPIEATAMALGIYADTGNLTYPGTRPADAAAVAWLLGQGAQLDVIAQFNQADLEPAQRTLLHDLVATAAPEPHQGLKVLVAGAKVDGYLEGVALVAHKLVALLEVDVAVLVVEMGKRTQFVARTRVPNLDLRPLLADWEVRGHPQACSAHGKHLALADALAGVRAGLAAVLPPEPVASDLMSAPVRTVPPDAAVTEVATLLRRHGHTALLVLDGDQLVGVISRRDIDRADHHGLGADRVADLMTREVVTASADTPRSQLEALMLARDIGRLPILHDGAVVGIVTRSDLLRVRYGSDLATHPQVSEWSRRLHSLWPREWLDLLEQVGAVAGDRPLYLVGGAVRDLLLERQNLDVDLVVEGDAIALARRVGIALDARTPGVKVTAHPPFGTAQVALPDGRKLDFASARTEYYTHPAALPTVEFSSIKQDLARRDFSVNALALRVDPGHLGELLDFFGGRRDLESGALRVLHNLSFLEDPTRLLRAVRFEQQLGFRLAEESQAYAAHTLASGRFDGLGGERNKQELKRLLSLPDPLPAMRRLAELDAWRILHPQLAPGPWRDVVRLRRMLAMAGLRAAPERWLTYLAWLLRPLPREAAAGVVQKLNLTGGEAKLVLDVLGQADRLLDAGEVVALAPADLVHALKTGPEVALAFLAAAATTRAQRRVLGRYWREWRPLKLSVSGDDLKELGLPPGPGYARILREVLDARLAGAIRTPAEERALLERLAREASP